MATELVVRFKQRRRALPAVALNADTAIITAAANDFMVRATFFTSEFQAGDRRTYTGWYGHRLREKGDGWEILVKQVNLIDCDQNLRNLSVIL